MHSTTSTSHRRRSGAVGAAADDRRKLLGRLARCWIRAVVAIDLAAEKDAVTDVADAPYRYCAGLDCLANKGVMLARILVPRDPEAEKPQALDPSAAWMTSQLMEEVLTSGTAARKRSNTFFPRWKTS